MVRIIIAMALLMQQFVCAESVWDQQEFEGRISGYEPQDNFPDGEPPYVSLRYRDALPEFNWFFAREGATTNQLTACLALAMTNNLSDEIMNDLPWIAEEE